MFDSMIALQPLVVARYLASGEAPRRVGNRHALSAPFGAFQARDGSFVLAVLNDKLFGILAECIGRAELARDPRFRTDSDRLANEAALRAAIEAWSSPLAAATYRARRAGRRLQQPCARHARRFVALRQFRNIKPFGYRRERSPVNFAGPY